MLGEELHPPGADGGEGDAGSACLDWQNKVEGGVVRGTEAMRFTKASVGPAAALAPVNRAVIEQECPGLNMTPLTLSGWHYSGGQLLASATLHNKWLLMSIFVLT